MHANGNTMPGNVFWALSLNHAPCRVAIHPLPARCYELSAIQPIHSIPQGLLPPDVELEIRS
jgi:hypothetical protein